LEWLSAVAWPWRSVLPAVLVKGEALQLRAASLLASPWRQAWP
jgi:hypothetical protein